jgi:uncharacterized protein (DUF1778 family)
MKNGNRNRAALLIRCTAEQAAQIRDAAQGERRTLSAYVVNAIMSRIGNREKVRQHLASRFNMNATGKAA